MPHDDIHVYAGALDAQADAGSGCLSEDERARAARFAFERDRRRYVTGRATLRHILSRYTGLAPERLVFRVGARGKPALVNEPTLRFNVAHSGGLAVYAVTELGELGVDVEVLERFADYEVIGERYFSPAERETLRNVPVSLRMEAFFTCWTRKEAYVKAIGEGLACPLDRFDVTLAPGQSARFLRVEGDEAEAWTLVDLQPAKGYVGALAVRAPQPPVQCWRWESL